nr:reverse transcriptase [Ipomoea batatas]
MQTTLVPVGICNEIDKKIRKFMWGGNDNKRSLNLVGSDTVTKPKELGGLGIRKTRDMNIAFMAKLGWRLFDEKDSVWAQVLRSKYLKGGQSIEDLKPARSSSNAWKGINRARNILVEGVHTHVRNGMSTRFWKDKWLTPEPLDWYALLDIPKGEHNMIVADYWKDGTSWDDFLFQGILPEEILDKLEAMLLTTDGEDSDDLVWRHSSNVAMWMDLLPEGERRRNWRRPFMEWFDMNISGKGACGAVEDGQNLFAITLWWLWKWRNEDVFKGVQNRIQKKANWIEMQVAETRAAFERARAPGSRDTRRSLLRWSKPESGWLKLNTDGRRNRRTGIAGCGGVFRDDKGNWIEGFIANLGIFSSEEAEAWAVLKGLKIAWERGFRKVMVETDANNIVEALNMPNSGSNYRRLLANIIQDCKQWLMKPWDITVTHIFREQNRVADVLAKRALSYDLGLLIFHQPVPEVVLSLEEDVLGFPQGKLVSSMS